MPSGLVRPRYRYMQPYRPLILHRVRFIPETNYPLPLIPQQLVFEADEDPKPPAKGTVGTNTSKIPKPPGEVNRPNSGGYTLDDKVPWDKDELNQIKVEFCQFAVVQMIQWRY